MGCVSDPHGDINTDLVVIAKVIAHWGWGVEAHSMSFNGKSYALSIRWTNGTAPRCRPLRPEATIRSPSGCSRPAEADVSAQGEMVASRCRQLQPRATTRLSSGCSMQGRHQRAGPK